MSEIKNIIAAMQSAIGVSVKPNVPLVLHEPDIGESERQTVMDCLDSGWVSSLGPMINEFEDKLAEYCGVSNVVACVNGTAALHIALYLAGVRPGDEVIVPAISFIATANAVIYNQAIPHFVDVNENDFSIDPFSLSTYLDEISEKRGDALFNKNTGRKISAIIPLHCFGYPCQINELVLLGERLGIPVVEDAAQTLGSFINNQALGSFGKASILSFNGNKIITTGGGGAILTNDADLARHARHLITTAKIPHSWEYNHDELGYNFRMPNLNAALGISQLGRMEEFLKNKATLHLKYTNAFSLIDGVCLLEGRAGSSPNHWLNVIVLSQSMLAKRDKIIAAAHDVGLMVRPLWGLLPSQPHLQIGPKNQYPVAKSLAERIICLPSSHFLGKLK